MSTVILIMFASIGAAAFLLLTPPPYGRRRAWLLRASWAMWVLQPALLVASMLVGFAVLTRAGYDSSHVPDDVAAWFNAGIAVTVGSALLAGTVLGGLAWRSARRAEPSSRRWWALVATLANALWFAGGAWLFLAPVIAVVLDVGMVALAAGLLLWPRQSSEVVLPPPPAESSSGPAADAPGDHLVG